MLTKRSILILCICILFMASAGACVPLRPAATGQWVGPDDAELAEDNLELIAHIEGAGLSIAVQGDYAYWGLSHELVILDIRDPAAPVRVASLPTPANDIVLDGAYAYLVGRGGLRIVDIQQPSAPKQISFVAFDRTPSALSVQNGYAYVVAYSKLHTVSVADPTQSEWIGAIRLAPRLIGVAAMNKQLFVVSEDGLHVLNIANPAQPVEVQVLPNTQLFYGPRVVEGTLYYGGEGVLYTTDIPPTGALPAPHEVQTSDWGNDLVVVNDVAYLANASAGLRVWDIHDRQSPRLLGAYPTTGNALALDYQDGLLFLADCDEGLHIFDARNPAELQLVSLISATGTTFALNAERDHVYLVAGFNTQLHLLELAASERLLPITIAGGYVEANDVAASGDYLYVLSDEGIRVWDVAQPPIAQEKASYPLRELGHIRVINEYLYVSDRAGNIWVLTYTPPDTLRQVAHYASLGYVNKMAVAGSMAYLFDPDVGMRILRVEPNGELTQLGIYTTPEIISSIAATADYAYLAVGEAGILIVDVTNPAAPSLAGRYIVPGEARDVALQANSLVVAAGTAGLVVLDLQNPTQPLPTAHYATLDCAHKVISAADRIYVADRFGGLFVLRYIDQR